MVCIMKPSFFQNTFEMDVERDIGRILLDSLHLFFSLLNRFLQLVSTSNFRGLFCELLISLHSMRDYLWCKTWPIGGKCCKNTTERRGYSIDQHRIPPFPATDLELLMDDLVASSMTNTKHQHQTPNQSSISGPQKGFLSSFILKKDLNVVIINGIIHDSITCVDCNYLTPIIVWKWLQSISNNLNLTKSTKVNEVVYLYLFEIKQKNAGSTAVSTKTNKFELQPILESHQCLAQLVFFFTIRPKALYQSTMLWVWINCIGSIVLIARTTWYIDWIHFKEKLPDQTSVNLKQNITRGIENRGNTVVCSRQLAQKCYWV